MGAKRVYSSVAVDAVDGGFGITLDGRPVRTPGGRRAVLPTRRLADAVAEEWGNQGERVDPLTMPLFGLACTGIDRVGADRAAMVRAIAAYAETDLLCYRAAAPAALAARQRTVWQPILDWAALRFDAPLFATEGVVPVAQPEQALSALRHAVERFADLPLAAVGEATAACGSVILALALAERRIGADEAFAAAHLDETYQMEQWGEDAEAARRRERIRGDIRAAARFLDLLSV
jgi:chaperone required for assembly of F1-ATPase